MCDNSGPAFPGAEGADGMSMRDYFAAKALQGEIIAICGIRADEYDRMSTARWCYLMADSMLNAREEINES